MRLVLILVLMAVTQSAFAGNPCTNHLNTIAFNSIAVFIHGENVAADPDAAFMFDDNQKLTVNKNSSNFISSKPTTDNFTEIEYWDRYSHIDAGKVVTDKSKLKLAIKNNAEGRVEAVTGGMRPDTEIRFVYNQGKCEIDNFFRTANGDEKTAPNVTRTTIYNRSLCRQLLNDPEVKKIKGKECSVAIRNAAEIIMMEARHLESAGIHLIGSLPYIRGYSSNSLSRDVFETIDKCESGGFYRVNGDIPKPVSNAASQAKPARIAK